MYFTTRFWNIKIKKNEESRKLTKSNSKLEFSCLFHFYYSIVTKTQYPFFDIDDIYGVFLASQLHRRKSVSLKYVWWYGMCLDCDPV